MTDDLAHLRIIEVLLNCANQSCRDSIRLKVLQCFLSDSSQVSPAKTHLGFSAETIELQVDLKTWRILGQTLNKFRLIGDSDTVTVDHQVLDRALFTRIKNFEEVRMQRWLTTAQLHYIWFAFILNNCIEHLHNMLQCAIGVRTVSAA